MAVRGAWFGLVYRRWNVIGRTGILAAIGAVLALGGFATMRRVTV